MRGRRRGAVRDAPAAIRHGSDTGDQLPADATPDAEVLHLAMAEIEKSGGKLTFAAASMEVLRANPELAQRYRYMPGVKDS